MELATAMSSTESSLNPFGTNEWAKWSVGTKDYVFTGGPLELRKYLLGFFSALIALPSHSGHSASRKVAFDWTDEGHTLPRNFIEVLPKVYQVGHDDESVFLISPECWTVRILADEINVELNQEGWKDHWDILNQSLTTAFVINSSTWNIISVHAACIEAPWGILLLCGPSNAGKSTLALGAAAAGASLISDDRVFVSLNPPMRISTLGSPVTFRAGTSHILPKLATYENSIEQKIVANPLQHHKYKIAVDLTQAFGIFRKFTTQAPKAIVVIFRDQLAGQGKWARLTGHEALLKIKRADPIPIYPSCRDEMLFKLIEQLEVWSFSYAFGDRKHFESTVRCLLGGP